MVILLQTWVHRVSVYPTWMTVNKQGSINLRFISNINHNKSSPWLPKLQWPQQLYRVGRMYCHSLYRTQVVKTNFIPDELPIKPFLCHCWIIVIPDHGKTFLWNSAVVALLHNGDFMHRIDCTMSISKREWIHNNTLNARLKQTNYKYKTITIKL